MQEANWISIGQIIPCHLPGAKPLTKLQQIY